MALIMYLYTIILTFLLVVLGGILFALLISIIINSIWIIAKKVWMHSF